MVSLLHTLNAKAEEEEVLWKAFRALVHSFYGCLGQFPQWLGQGSQTYTNK